MKYCTRMQLTITTLFLTAHAHILNLELWGSAIEEICWVAEAVCCCKMLNFTVYKKTSRKTSVPWRIHVVNPPDLTFRGFLTCLLCQVVSGLYSRVPVGCYSDYNAIMVYNVRPPASSFAKALDEKLIFNE